jgi:hypothetical protein
LLDTQWEKVSPPKASTPVLGPTKPSIQGKGEDISQGNAPGHEVD